MRSKHPIKGNKVGGTGKKGDNPKPDGGKSRKPAPRPSEDDEIEDCDIATPKRDRSDDDDQPL
ncbi:MAG: hypothetical protein E7813_12295 [Bradyrhizobium sp.]|uniref:hypothetical protein n=1 Tax=Bradyrhizobium sp. TaxID=376 RepID=UPI0011F691BE|nr:hypothetical protein [Bradyrhizobium sp.]THD66942.1 MAG: hypothetical protein E7813_12295 [Bradyrhizobium sp.]